MPIFGNLIKQVHSKLNSPTDDPANYHSAPIPKRTAFHRGDVITTWEKKLPIFASGDSSPSSSKHGKIAKWMKRMDTAVVVEDCSPGNVFIAVRFESCAGYVCNDTEKVQHAMEYKWWTDSGKSSELRKQRAPEVPQIPPKQYQTTRLYQAVYPVHGFADPTLKVFSCEIPASSLLMVRSTRPHEDEHQVVVSLCLMGTRNPQNGLEFVASEKYKEHMWVSASNIKEFVLMLVDPAMSSSAMNIAKPIYLQVGEVYRLISHQTNMSDAEGRVLREIPTGSIVSVEVMDAPSRMPTLVRVRSATDGTYGWITALSTDAFLLEKIPECRIVADLIVKGDSAKAIKRIAVLEEKGLSNVPLLNGNNALHMACKYGRSAIVDKMCTSSKTNVLAWNANGESAAHCIIQNDNVACSVGRTEKSLVELKMHVLKLLRDAKADHNAGDNLGRTPLMYCTKFVPVGAVPIADFLLTFKADPNACSTDNRNSWQLLKLKKPSEKPHLRPLLLQVLLKHHPAGEPDDPAKAATRGPKIGGSRRNSNISVRGDAGRTSGRAPSEHEMKRLKKSRARRDRQGVMAALSPSCLFVKSTFALTSRTESPAPPPKAIKEEKRRIELDDLIEDPEKKAVRFAEVLQSACSAPRDYVPLKGNLGKRKRHPRSRNSVGSCSSVATFKSASRSSRGRRSSSAPVGSPPKIPLEAAPNQMLNRWADEKVRENEAIAHDKDSPSEKMKGSDKGKGRAKELAKDKGHGKGTQKSGKGK
eukprot:GEMP01007040.1.p1 GENE.GEMP01007040.1~~GEMP01007040.1.p1  ORF type:complete len:756 (+),score=152.99 GEMP01007040.1:615-2882(+)